MARGASTPTARVKIWARTAAVPMGPFIEERMLKITAAPKPMGATVLTAEMVALEVKAVWGEKVVPGPEAPFFCGGAPW